MRDENPDLPQVVFVHQGSVEEGEGLLARLWPEAMAISDSDLVLFSHFSLGRGPLGQILGPRTWGSALRALLKGHFVGRPIGDPLVMPGVFLAHGERILWSHAFAHIGDLPDGAALERASRLASEAGPIGG